MDEAKAHPVGDQGCLPLDGGVEEGKVGCVVPGKVGVVPGDGMVGQSLDPGLVAPGGEELEGADAQVAGGDAGEDGTGQLRLCLLYTSPSPRD